MDTSPESVIQHLTEHEAASQKRYEDLKGCLQHMKETTMEHGVSDKVDVHNIFKGMGTGEGGSGAPWAAMLPALMTSQHGSWGGLGGGLGAGLLGGVLGGLLFNRRDGFGGGWGGEGSRDGGGSGAVERFISQQTLGDIKRDIATSANETQAVVNSVGANGIQTTLQQTIALQQQGFQSQLAAQAGFENTKDAVQTTGTVLLQALNNVNQNVSEQACSVKQVVVEDGEKTRALLTSRFQLEDATRINELNARVIELQSEGRRSADNADLRLQITNTNTAVAAQQQGQQQQQQQQMFTAVQALFPLLHGLTQIAHATNSNVIAGNTGAVTTGAQAANPVNVAA